MKVEDLRIGDLVYCTYWPEKRIVRVYELKRNFNDELMVVVMDEIPCTFPEKYIEPIPLTPEILEKNSFTECNVDDDGAVQYEFGFDDLGIDVWIAQPILLGAWRRWPDLKDTYSMINELPIRYVHELQHALCLCGIDKEITL